MHPNPQGTSIVNRQSINRYVNRQARHRLRHPGGRASGFGRDYEPVTLHTHEEIRGAGFRAWKPRVRVSDVATDFCSTARGASVATPCAAPCDLTASVKRLCTAPCTQKNSPQIMSSDQSSLAFAHALCEKVHPGGGGSGFSTGHEPLAHKPSDSNECTSQCAPRQPRDCVRQSGGYSKRERERGSQREREREREGIRERERER